MLVVDGQSHRLLDFGNDGIHGTRQAQGITRILRSAQAEQNQSPVELE